MTNQGLKKWLNQKADYYNRPFFIEKDPISVPHQYSKKQDIEISGFFAAIFAWGNRTTIINKANTLMQMMDNSPHQFCTQHQQKDLKRMLGFVHRTFNATDLLYTISFLKSHYTKSDTLETAFANFMQSKGQTIEQSLVGFHRYFFSLEYAPERTRKHIATPERGSTCKRLCMYLRWMVRTDERGVDFGIWKQIKPMQLVMPMDVHVLRVARELGLIQRKQTDWQTALELTDTLKTFDKYDPVKYDFALFGTGVMEKQ